MRSYRRFVVRQCRKRTTQKNSDCYYHFWNEVSHLLSRHSTEKWGRTTIFRPNTIRTGYAAYAISFSRQHHYPKFALLRSTAKKGEK